MRWRDAEKIELILECAKFLGNSKLQLLLLLFCRGNFSFAQVKWQQLHILFGCFFHKLELERKFMSRKLNAFKRQHEKCLLYMIRKCERNWFTEEVSGRSQSLINFLPLLKSVANKKFLAVKIFFKIFKKWYFLKQKLSLT